ncbi:MAG: hypothetical protein JNM28_02180 [Armatimonadetes bacterium]|nr:hypothetical protein [Armatimonadota bacterium]
MRGFFLAVALALAAWSAAQAPETVIAVDLRPTILFGDGRNAWLRWYDAYAFPSTFGIKGRFSDGQRFAVTQRLAKQLSDGDPDQVDEFYLENPGEWKIGKQAIPFGQKVLYRETAPALRLSTQLLFEGARVDFAVLDAGPGRPRGVIGRIGGNSGLSFAFGEHFAVQDTALAILRQDVAGLGRGRGYQSMYGADTTIFAFPYTFEAEAISLRQGHTPLDGDRDITDLRAGYQLPNGRDRLRVAWSHDWSDKIDSFRIDGEFVLANQVVLMPHIRFGSNGLGQYGTTLRFRL